MWATYNFLTILWISKNKYTYTFHDNQLSVPCFDISTKICLLVINLLRVGHLKIMEAKA